LDIFERCAHKVYRATQHLHTLQTRGEAFGKEYGDPGFRCVIEPNSQRTEILVKIDQEIVIPDVEWGIIIGDAVHCLRSALDQLAAGLRADPPDGRTRFPICTEKKQWLVGYPGMLWSVPAKYVAVFDAAQPYHRGNRANEHPLAMLNALWNLDKHHAIPAAALLASHTKVQPIRGENFPNWESLKFRPKTGCILEKGAILASAKYRDSDTGPNAKVYVDAHITTGVAFGAITGKAAVVSRKPVHQTFKNALVPAVFDVILNAMTHSPSGRRTAERLGRLLGDFR
jgi:hypothetical protein